MLQLSHSIQLSLRELPINSLVAGEHAGQVSSVGCAEVLVNASGAGDGDFGALRAERRFAGAMEVSEIIQVTSAVNRVHQHVIHAE